MEDDDKEKGPPGARAEGDEPDGDEAPAAAKCGKCEGENPAESKYCNHCGLSLGGMPADPAEAADGDEEEDEDDEKKGPPGASAGVYVSPARAAVAARSPGAATSLAALAGLRPGASQPAILASLSRRVDVFAAAAKLTGHTSPGAIVGGLQAMASEAAKLSETQGKLVKAQRTANARERMDLLGKLEAGGVHTRGELFEDIVADDSSRSVKPAKLWSAGPEGRTLANLRGYATTKLANAGSSKRDPFVPDMAAAQAAAGKGDGKPTAAQVEAAKKNPTVLGMFNRPGNAKSLDQIATAFCASGFGGTQ